MGRFAQADTIVPGGVQGQDRYAYTNNNPILYTDPSGHGVDCGFGMGCVKDLPKSTGGGGDENGSDIGDSIDNQEDKPSPDIKITINIHNSTGQYFIDGMEYETYCINAEHCSSLTWYVISDYQEQLHDLMVNGAMQPYTANDAAKDIFLHYLELSPAGDAISEISFWAETGSQSSENQIKAAYSAILKSISHSPAESGQPIIIELYEKINNSDGQGAGVLSASGYGERYNVELGGWAGGSTSANLRSVLDSLPIPSFP